jgi:hypothetical protein
MRGGESQQTSSAGSRLEMEVKVRVSFLEPSIAVLVEKSARRCRVNYLV